MSSRSSIFAFEVFYLVSIQLYLPNHSQGLGVGVGDARLWGLGHRCMWDRTNISQEFPIKKSYRWVCPSGSEAQLGSNFTERMPSAGVRWHSWENPVYWPSPLWVYHGLTTGISKVFSCFRQSLFYQNACALGGGALHEDLLLASVLKGGKRPECTSWSKHWEGPVLTAWGTAESCQELTFEDSYHYFSIIQYCFFKPKASASFPDALGVSHLAFCTHPALWLTSAHCIIIVLTFRSPSLECQLPGLVLPYKSLPHVGTSPGKCFASYLSHHTFTYFLSIVFLSSHWNTRSLSTGTLSVSHRNVSSAPRTVPSNVSVLGIWYVNDLPWLRVEGNRVGVGARIRKGLGSPRYQMLIRF